MNVATMIDSVQYTQAQYCMHEHCDGDSSDHNAVHGLAWARCWFGDLEAHTTVPAHDWMTDKCVEIRIGSSAGYLPYCNGTHLQCSTKVPP